MVKEQDTRSEDLQLAFKIQAVLDGIELQAREPRQMPAADSVTLGLYGRLRNLTECVLRLAELDRPDAAFMLCRSVIEDDFRIRQLEEAGDDRYYLIASYVIQSNRKIQSAYSHLKNAGAAPPGALKRLSQRNRDQEHQLGEFLKARGWDGVSPMPNFMDEQNYAKKSGRLRDLADVELLHHLVHGSDLSLALGRSPLQDGVINIAPVRHQRLADVAALMAAEYSLDACEGMAAMFGWQGTEVLADLRQALEKRGEELARETGGEANGQSQQ